MRHTSLPKPGSDEQLKKLSARVMAQQLDRNRPLWEIWVVEGLRDGRFAVISYDGNVCWGFNADLGLVPDLSDFVRMVRLSFERLAEVSDVKLTAAIDAEAAQA